MTTHNDQLSSPLGRTDEVHYGRDRSFIEKRRYARFAANESATIRTISPVVSGIQPIRVLDTSKEGLRLRVSEFLFCGATVEIRLADSIVFGEVRHCRRAGSAFEAGIRIQDTFPAPHRETPFLRRKELRNPAAGGGVMRIEDGPEGVYSITILNVSKTGLRVSCPTKPSPHAHVEITCGSAKISGTIRYVRELSQDEFNLGISADRVSGDDRFGDDKEMDLTLLFGGNSCD